MENTNSNNKSFETRMQNAVKSDNLLSSLIETFQKVDYQLIVYGDEIDKLRKDYNNEKDNTRKYELLEELKNYQVKMVQKHVILVEKLLEHSRNVGNELSIYQNSIYIYDGKYWKNINKHLFSTLLSEIAIKSGIDHLIAKQQDEIERLNKQFFRSGNFPEIDLEDDCVKINLNNGTFTVDKENSILKCHDSDDFLKYILPFDYNPSATAPMFTKFLNTVLPDKQSQLVLSEYIGYIFNKSLKLEKCLLILGNGANGKSVFFEIIKALFGANNICHFTLQNLCDEKGYHRASIGQKLLNYSSEIGARKCPPDTIKKLISGEPIDARLPFGEPFEISNYCRFIFNTNSLPKETEQSVAFYRRFIIVKFEVTIPKEERDPFLAKKIIQNELSGIFNWVVEGLERITKQKGFTHAPLIEAELSMYEEESNSVGLFMDDNGYKPSTQKHTERKYLYEAYMNYCRENGYIQVGGSEFSRRLENLGFRIKRKATNNATLVYCDNSVIDQQTDSIIKEILL